MNNKYTINVKMIQTRYKDNDKYYRKIYLIEIKVYKYILYKDSLL